MQVPKTKSDKPLCFEHRVNVCEQCLVVNHEKCIVKSYLLWLQDSDYNPTCGLCNRSLSDEKCGDCVRLPCYDVFHWVCLHNYCQQLPSTTAPAGYTCPSCNTCVFPPAQLATPVAHALRQLLQRVNWARAGLGLPLIDEDELPPPPVPLQTHDSTDTPVSNATSPSAQVVSYAAKTTLNPVVGFHSMFGADETNSSRQLINPRKLFDSTKDDGLFTQCLDHDENKYRRRPAFQWLADWFRSSRSDRRRGDSSPKRRVLMFLIISILTFITLVILFSQLSHDAIDDDPFLDPMNNPNIKVEQKLMEVN